MRISLIKTGLPIANTGKTGGEGEAYNIMKLLSKNFIIDYYTEELSDEAYFANRKNIYEEEFNKNKYDVLVVLNGLANPFDKELDRRNYEIMKQFDEIVYIFCDPKLPLQSFKGTEFDISDKKIYVIHQSYNIEPFKHLFEDFKDITYIHFPFHKYPLINDRLNLESVLKLKEIDLGYGGSLRKGRRKQQIVNWYFDLPEEISVEIFGRFTKDDFSDVKHNRIPEIGKPVDYDKFIWKMSTFRATINLGDYEYYGNNLNQRIYESILANTVSFIDAEYDIHKLVYQDKDLRDFLYVKDKNELIDKIKYLKSNEQFYKSLLDKQYDDVKIDKGEYAQELCDIIFGILINF